MQEEQINEEKISNVANTYDLLISGPFRKYSSSPKRLLSNLLESTNYFDLPEAKTSQDGRLKKAFAKVGRYVEGHLNEPEKRVLRECIKRILEKHLREIRHAAKVQSGIQIKDRILMTRLPGIRHDVCYYFLNALEELLGGVGDKFLPCQVYLFGPFARGTGSRDCYVNIAIISEGFSNMSMDERKHTLQRLVASTNSLLIPIGITPVEELEQKYPLGQTKILFECRRRPGRAYNWEL